MLPPAAAERDRAARSCIVNRCPGCGGEVSLAHEYDLTTCAHCGSVLRVENPPALRAYTLRPRISLREAQALTERALRAAGQLDRARIEEPEGWLIPYWYFHGQLLKKRTSVESAVLSPESAEEESLFGSSAQEYERITTRVTLTATDESWCAVTAGNLYPDRLTAGQQLLPRFPLVTVGENTSWQIAEPRRAAAAAITLCGQAASNIGNLFDGGAQKNPTRFFVQRRSLLFAPFYRWTDQFDSGRAVVVDAITGDVQMRHEGITPQPTTAPNRIEYARELVLVPHRCSHCAQDLPARFSLLYRCANCSAMIVNAELEGRVCMLPVSDASVDSLWWFPFWFHPTAVTSRPDGGRTLAAAIPAFAIRNADVAVRLSRQVGKVLAGRSPVEELEGMKQFAPVTIRQAECAALAEAGTARSAMDGLLPDRRSVQGEEMPLPGRVIFVPFVRRGYEFSDAVVNAICFHSGALGDFVSQ